MTWCTRAFRLAVIALSGAGCTLLTSADGLSGGAGRASQVAEAASDPPSHSDAAFDHATDEPNELPSSEDALPDTAAPIESDVMGCSDTGPCGPPSCTNGEKDGTETAVDCGGTCAPCVVGEVCLVAGDCVTKVCSSVVRPATPGDAADEAASDGPSSASDDTDAGLQSRCQAASCDDRVLNGLETDVDCGGSCPKCPSGAKCGSWADCQGGVCVAGKCAAPMCGDGVFNGNETALDCGGGCSPCPVGQRCLGAPDCASKVCKTQICQSPTCQDAVMNGSETDDDCGGAACPKCAQGRRCSVSSDCQGGWCKMGTCR